MAVGRPGTGGQMPLAVPFTQASATEELVRELGPPRLLGQLRVWSVNPKGDGILFARLSGRDVKGGETAMGQVAPLRELAASLGLVPRLITVSCSNSGARRYEQRPDFRLAEQAILEERWCRWVAWRNADRIARDDLPLALFYDLLKQTGTGLYLADLGRAIDWEDDRLELGFRGLMSIEERAAIKQRTHGALERRWIARQRGWPGARPFGFRRNWATKYVEVDPEQWSFVKLIHRRYARLEDGTGVGLRKLADELRAAGCELSHNRIRRVLQDPIYVTGEYSVTYKGERVECRPVSIADPIPEELHQRNTELLALTKARHSRTPLGLFCLNGVPIEHQACAHLRNAKGQRPLLKGRIHKKRAVYAYRHEPWVPTACVGYVIDQSVLEGAVMSALSEELASSELLELAWTSKSPTAADRSLPGFLDPEERQRISREIGALKRRKAQLARAYRSRLVRGEEVNELAYWDLVGGIQEEVSQLQRCLELSDEFGRQAVRGAPRRDLQEALQRVLSPTPPEDDSERIKRAALVQALVDKVVLRDGPEGGVCVEVHTRVLPRGASRSNNETDGDCTQTDARWKPQAAMHRGSGIGR